MPGELKSKSKLYLKDDCDADSAHWQWGEDNVIKNFANEKLCVSATSEGNGQAIIMANCNQASTKGDTCDKAKINFRLQASKNGIHSSVVVTMSSKNREQN